MESRLGRILNTKKLKYSVAGAMALLGSLTFAPDVSAQSIDSSQPGEVGPQKPKAEPLLVPRPVTKWVEPSDLDQLIEIASFDMSISPSYARKIILCESEGDPHKINPRSGARGLWQIMPLHAEKFVKRGWDYWRDWSNGYRNTKVASDIMEKQGASAWDCS